MLFWGRLLVLGERDYDYVTLFQFFLVPNIYAIYMLYNNVMYVLPNSEMKNQAHDGDYDNDAQTLKTLCCMWYCSVRFNYYSSYLALDT